MKKVKRFQEGGYEDTDDYKNLMKAQAREDANAAEPGTETTPEFMKRTGTKANPPMSRTFTSKGPIVTKEQMKKAGFDNLRDYLNAERGLTRRSDAPSVAKSESKKSEKTEKAEPSDRSVAKAEGSFADRQSYKRATREAQADEKRKAMGMKKGGSVGSASNRADGIATRGKTRGRMV